MSAADAVAYAWQRLTAWHYRPELMTARETLRMVPIEVDKEAFRAAWDQKASEVLRDKSKSDSTKARPVQPTRDQGSR